MARKSSKPGFPPGIVKLTHFERIVLIYASKLVVDPALDEIEGNEYDIDGACAAIGATCRIMQHRFGRLDKHYDGSDPNKVEASRISLTNTQRIRNKFGRAVLGSAFRKHNGGYWFGAPKRKRKERGEALLAVALDDIVGIRTANRRALDYITKYEARERALNRS